MANLSIDYLMSKTGPLEPATRQKCIEIIKAAQAAGHVVRFVWGYDPNPGNPEHHSRRALDIMVNTEAAGDFIRNYIWANRKRFALRHVIWEQHITSTVVQPGVRRKMANRGNTTANHYDHNHVLFNPQSSYSPPSGPAPKPKPVKKPSAPKPVKVRLLKQGARGNDVRKLQSELRRVFPAYAGRLYVDGVFGPQTRQAVKEFQRRAGLSSDGIVGAKTRSALKKHGVRL